MPDRQYDVILYGASGFTGRQTVQYFARHAAGAVRWAIAGRNPQQLAAAKQQAGDAAADAEIIMADARDQKAIDAMVSKTRVLLSTAGPFSLYGNGIVDACVRFQTHYVDITGETPWVRDLIDRHHARAAADGTRIVPCCGFDSIPADLGAYLVVRHMQKTMGVDCRLVKGYYQFSGGLNGGTFASALNLNQSGNTTRMREMFLLNPPKDHSEEEKKNNYDSRSAQFDPDIGAWAIPFFMGMTNSRIVRRSAGLFEHWGEPYGLHFGYQEFQKFSGSMAGLRARGILLALGLFQLTMRSSVGRGFLKALAPSPGHGPSEKSMDDGFFKCELVGIATGGGKVRGVISDKGDPGNRATVKFLCESALALALNFDALPGGPRRGGILTPATALGDVLAGRLRKAGMKIEIAS